MNDLYRYLYAIPGFYRYKIYLLYIMVAILAYIIIMPVITRKKGGIKKRMLFGVLLIFFTGLAFYINLLINYWVITEPLTNSIDLYGFVPKIKLYKLCDYEYKRGLVEIATYIPIGMILSGWLKKKKTASEPKTGVIRLAVATDPKESAPITFPNSVLLTIESI